MGSATRPWVLVAIGLVALGLSQPLFLLVLWKFHINPGLTTSATDLGAIMGAIFTAGGLVVAIVSIYTMASIDKVTRQAVEPLLTAIPEQIDARIRRFLEAYGFYTRAQEVAGRGGFPAEALQSVDDLIAKALALEPTLTGVCAFTAKVYYVAAATMYWRDRVPEEFDGGYQLPSRDEFPAVTAKAVSWLVQALERNDGDTREIAAELAEVHGMMHASTHDTLKYVQLANDGARTLPSGPSSLMMLFGACKNEDDVLSLARALDLQAPLSTQQIEALLLQEQPEAGRGPRAEHELLTLLVVLRFELREGRYPESPGIVRVLYGARGQAMITWRPRLQPGPLVQKDGIPAFGEVDQRTGYPTSSQPIEITELAEQLARQFYVVSTFTRDRFPERA
jgi:hypothetical protein